MYKRVHSLVYFDCMQTLQYTYIDTYTYSLSLSLSLSHSFARSNEAKCKRKKKEKRKEMPVEIRSIESSQIEKTKTKRTDDVR